MKTSDVAKLLDEPACSHNLKEKSGCAKSKPGATDGGCTFDGAQIALLPIADVAHIVHGSIACAGSSWDSRGTRSSGSTLYRIGMTTDLSEQDIVMGRGEKRLFHAIKQAIDQYAPAAVFVYNTCVPALMGDDLEAVCKDASGRWGTPVVPVDGAGFYGSKNLGNRIAGESMLRYVIGTREPEPLPLEALRPNIKVHDINLIGEYNIAGEFWHVLPLLDELGLRVLCTLSGDARFHQVQTMHRAELNMMVCSKAMLNVARKLEERYGTPWFEGSFYGITDTSQALRTMADLLGDRDLQERTEALIRREELRIQTLLEPWKARLQGKRVLLYTGGVKSWSVVSALQDLGMKVVASGTKKSTEEDKMRIRALMGDAVKMLDEGNPRILLQTVEEYQADLLIAGGRNMYTALKAKIPFLDINQEREFGYAGYEGMLELVRQLALTLDCPVWNTVRQPAPWECGGAVRSQQEHGTREGTAVVRIEKKALAVSPLKISQTVGAALAFLGMQQSIPLLHGSQGCTAFSKVFFVRHFREPIPLQTTAMDQVSTIMGGEEHVVEALRVLCERHHPKLIGLVTTGLVEMQGCYVSRWVDVFRQRYPVWAEKAIVVVSTPDFEGSLESGFARALQAMIEQLVPAHTGRASKRALQVTVLCHANLTPGDLEFIRESIESFDLCALLVPDLSGSLDGHLESNTYNSVTTGGLTLDDLTLVADSSWTLSVGRSIDSAADALRHKTGVPDERFAHLQSLDQMDRWFMTLIRISGKEVPQRWQKQRRQFLDSMLDTHFMLSELRVALAGEADLLAGLVDLLQSMGAQVVAAVAPVRTSAIACLPLAEVVVGDLDDLEYLARKHSAQLVIANSHALALAKRLGIPLLRAGYPQYDILGGFRRQWIGYAGMRNTLFDLANLLLENHHGITPYRSIFHVAETKQGEQV